MFTLRTHKSESTPVKTKDARVDSHFSVSASHEEIHFVLDVKNVGGKHLEITFPTGQSHDFVVVDSVGREVWRWSHGRIFTQGVQNKQLGSGDVMELSERWKPAAKPGHYTAIATLKSSNYPVEQRVEFVVQ
jgi:hypothetical protein